MHRAPGSDDAFLAYATASRIVGLSAWPVDGDPAHNVGLIAHPGAVLSTAVSYNGRKLVTLGGWVAMLVIVGVQAKIFLVLK